MHFSFHLGVIFLNISGSKLWRNHKLVSCFITLYILSMEQKSQVLIFLTFSGYRFIWVTFGLFGRHHSVSLLITQTSCSTCVSATVLLKVVEGSYVALGILKKSTRTFLLNLLEVFHNIFSWFRTV